MQSLSKLTVLCPCFVLWIITFLGANSLFGRVASALLSRTPSVKTLKLYDETGFPQQNTNGEQSCLVQWHSGKAELINALEGSDIVVIGDDSKVILNNEKEALISTASKVVDFVYAVAQTSPKAMVVVAASPLNLMVPLTGYVLKELGCYDSRKLLGVTSVDTLRANAIYSEYISRPNSILPVVGGASPQTRVPIFSHARPSLDLPEEELHLLIDKIKSFDLKMEGPEFKASTFERAYATVRLVNSLLSGLQEEPRTKEMALAKTSLIPEVNYFSLPVDLGKSGIERTFGLPQLSPLETEMIDYAIINLNNDLIKAQDLYASFKPCFEMFKSIVGGPSKHSDVANEDCSAVMDHKIDLRKKNDHKIVSNKRKRSEQQTRNRKRARTNKFPIVHCPAPEVVTDVPIEEKFGKIERVHKKLQVNQVLQRINADGLPRLQCNDVSDVDQPQSLLEPTDRSLIEVDPINQKVDSDPVLLNCTEATNIELPFTNSEVTKIIDLFDTPNKATVVDEAEEKNTGSKNKLRNKDETEITKATIDLKSKIIKKNQYEHLQPRAQSQSSRIEMMKSLMQQKPTQKQKTKVLCRSNSTSQYKIDCLKKIVTELNKSSIVRSSNKSFSIKAPREEENNKEIVGESNNNPGTGKKTNKSLNMSTKEEKIEKINLTALEIDSFDEQLNLIMKDVDEQNGPKMSDKNIKSRTETNGDQNKFLKKEVANPKVTTEIEIKGDNAMLIPKKEVVTTKEKINETKDTLSNESDSMEHNGMINKINYETPPFSENKQQVERQQIVHESLKKETCQENKSNIELTSVDNNEIPTANDKPSELNQNKIIPEESITLTEGNNELIKDRSAETSLDLDISEQKHEQSQITSSAEITKEAEEQNIKSNIHDLTKEISEIISESTNNNETNKQKFSFTIGQTLDEGKTVIEINAQEKLEELECLSKIKKNDELEENNTLANTSKVNHDPLEQINKIREITTQQIKEALKHPDLNKERNSREGTVNETEQDKEKKKAMKMEETKEAHTDDKVTESIKVFNYEPNNIHNTNNITNINEIIHALVKANKPEANSERIPAVPKSINNIKDEVRIFDSISTKVKVENEKIKATKEWSKDKKSKKDDKPAPANIDLECKKASKEKPFPFLNNVKEMPKKETFDKNKWVKTIVQPDANEATPAKVNLKTIDETKALAIQSRNINESFTKRIQTGHLSKKTTEDMKSISYKINTKNKKDELSKRYTVLKKGQLCNMVKNDINADELKAKLYHNSFMRATNKPSLKKGEKDVIHAKDLSASGLPKSPPINKEMSTSKPAPRALENTKKVSLDISMDLNNLKKIKKGNTNAITLKNKSFLNMIINRTSERSPTLNETNETIGVRGSHYESGANSKNPTTPNEQMIQQLTKKAKEQLNLTRFKNDKRISQGLRGSLPVVSGELDAEREPVMEEDKTKSTKDSANNMQRSINKIQMMKERYQRLKNRNLSPKNPYASSPPTGANLIKKKESTRVVHGNKNQLSESSSKRIPEPKKLMNKEEIVKKQGYLSSIEMIGKEIATSIYGKTKSEAQGLVLNEKGDYSNTVDTNTKQVINSSEVFNKKHSIEKEERSEPSQIILNPSDDKNIATVGSKISSQASQQDSQDKNKPTKESFVEQQEFPKAIDVEKNIKATSNTQNATDTVIPQPLKDEIILNIEKVDRNTTTNIKQLNLKKKSPYDRPQEKDNLKSKERVKESKDIYYSKESANNPSKMKTQQPKTTLDNNNPPMMIKSPKKKGIDENTHRAALKAVFASRPTTRDLMKIKKEQKISQVEIPHSTMDRVPSHNLGVRSVHNKLIPSQSTASSLLLDPDIEKRPQTNRKVIHPSLMHAVKPFPSQNPDLSKLKTSFYSRWTPQSLKSKDTKEADSDISKKGQIQKNPFVSGNLNLTSDLFKAYMKKNRNYEPTNSNTDAQFLHQSGQLASIPQQAASANASRINGQRVAFSTLEANSNKIQITKTKMPAVASSLRFQTKNKGSNNEKKERPQFFNRRTSTNNILYEAPQQESTVNGRNIPNSSNKSKQPAAPKHKPKLTQNNLFYPFRPREKEVDLKKMHLLKAYQNQENNEQKFEELQRNYKQQLSRTPPNSFKTQPKEGAKETPNRLQLLKTNSLKSITSGAPEVSCRNKKQFSAPAEYHPSFPLSKPKKYEKNNKKDENVNTLKKRWSQLLDIFQSVITTEKKNWEQDNPGRNLLIAGGHQTTNAIVPKTKVNLRETSDKSNSTAKIVQSYYRRHTGGPKFQNSYSIANRPNKM